MFKQDFTCPVLLKDKDKDYLYGTITHSGPTFQKVPIYLSMPLAWSAFARHY